MIERPILFSAPMVLALLAGAKTQTRRVLKMPPKFKGWAPCEREGMPSPDTTVDARGLHIEPWTKAARTKDEDCYDVLPCPYGKPGDRLWVKETWRTEEVYDELAPSRTPMDATIWFEADGKRPPIPPPHDHLGPGKGRPGIFMMRCMSRLTLEVTAVRVERLNDISDADAIAEGIEWIHGANGYHCPSADESPGWWDHRPIHAYRALWESINGSGSWKLNPFVWVVEFRRLP